MTLSLLALTLGPKWDYHTHGAWANRQYLYESFLPVLDFVDQRQSTMSKKTDSQPTSKWFLISLEPCLLHPCVAVCIPNDCISSKYPGSSILATSPAGAVDFFEIGTHRTQGSKLSGFNQHIHFQSSLSSANSVGRTFAMIWAVQIPLAQLFL